TYDVHVELPQHTTIVLLIGLGESVATLLRIAGDVEEIVARLRRPDPVQLVSGPASPASPTWRWRRAKRSCTPASRCP
ncbi:MAG TPA: hypothetical protein VI029_18285, partial [Mycobacterium sp.]